MLAGILEDILNRMLEIMLILKNIDIKMGIIRNKLI